MRKIGDKEMVRRYADQFGLDAIMPEELFQTMTIQEYDRTELICSTGDKLEYMYFLVSGKLKIYSSHSNGKSLMVRFHKPLSVIGDVELLNGYDVRCSIEALIPSRLLVVSFDQLRKSIDNDARFWRFLVENLSYKLYTFSSAAAMNLLSPLENRFASYLLSTCFDENDNPFTPELKSTKLTEVSMILGTSYRHLVRVVREFTRQKIIERERGMIRIIDPAALRTLAGGHLYE